MIAFPNCKINLGLRVLSKRADGYHDIESVFLPIPVNDVLEVISSPSSAPGTIKFDITCTSLFPDLGENICVKAYHAMQREVGTLPSVAAHLFKSIPVGAGLGGGSADGVWMLKILNEKFRLNLPGIQLHKLALELGSDCPFFLLNKPAYATGRGEVLEAVTIDLSGVHIALINPGIQISTAWAFKNLARSTASASVKAVIKRPIKHWKENLVNDFESGVFEQYPEIGRIKGKLYEQGAVYASMTGTGSTVYGIFQTQPSLDHLFPPDYFVRMVRVVQ